MSEKLQPLSPSQRETLEELTSEYTAAMTGEVIDYLMDRGLDLETVGNYRIGVVDNGPPGYEWLRGWLSIPYLDKDGNPLKLRFRRPPDSDHPAKYMDLAGGTVRMFNVGAIHRAVQLGDTIHIAEGELDALILEQMGLPAVAIPGAESWRSHHRRMLAGFNHIWTWADSDGPGLELANKISASLRNAKVVRLGEGDVGENYLQHGPDYLLGLIGYNREAAA